MPWGASRTGLATSDWPRSDSTRITRSLSSSGGGRTRIESPEDAAREALVSIELAEDERDVSLRDLAIDARGQIGVRAEGGRRVELRRVQITATASGTTGPRSAILAIGAWVAARIFFATSLPFPVVLLLSGLITMVIGTIVGLPALRVSGLYLALITLMLAGAISVVLAATDFKARLYVQGMAPVGNTPAQFAKAMDEESKHWAAVVKNRKLSAN